jgi:hypothetical protein
MYKRPVPRPTFAVDHSTLKLARVEDSIVHKLIHSRPFPPHKPSSYVPIYHIEDIIRYYKIPCEEAEEIRRKNYIAPAVQKKIKKTKKRVAVQHADLEKMFSQFTTKPAGKKKVLKAVVKKI